MGSTNTTTLSNEELYKFRLGNVRVAHPTKGKELVFYYQPGKAIFLIEPGEIVLKDCQENRKSTSFSIILILSSNLLLFKV